VSEVNDEDVSGHIDDLEHASEVYMTIKTLLANKIYKSEQFVQNPVTLLQAGKIHQNISLPPLYLPTYGGKFDDWETFNDRFKSTIHTNNSIIDAETILFNISSCVNSKQCHLNALVIIRDEFVKK